MHPKLLQTYYLCLVSTNLLLPEFEYPDRAERHGGDRWIAAQLRVGVAVPTAHVVSKYKEFIL